MVEEESPCCWLVMLNILAEPEPRMCSCLIQPLSILWSFLECLNVSRMIVAFSAEMEMSEHWMGWDPECEVIASPIQWNKEKNRVCSRNTLCR